MNLSYVRAMMEIEPTPDLRGFGPISAIVLCGGAGRRAGGADKPLFEYRGQPLVAHVVASLAGRAERILISANRNLDRYQPHGEVVTDQTPDHPGPLAGIIAGLRHIDDGLVIVAPGDAPAVQEPLWSRLFGVMARTPATAVCAHDGDRRQPLFFVVNVRLLKARLGNDYQPAQSSAERSVRAWLAQIEALDVDCSDLSHMMVDVDNLEALERLVTATDGASDQVSTDGDARSLPHL